MLTKEWKLEDALAVRYAEGYEDGWKLGYEEGWKIGYEEGLKESWKSGARRIVEMLKSGRSPEEIIRDFDTATRADPAVSEPPALP